MTSAAAFRVTTKNNWKSHNRKICDYHAPASSALLAFISLSIVQSSSILKCATK